MRRAKRVAGRACDRGWRRRGRRPDRRLSARRCDRRRPGRRHRVQLDRRDQAGARPRRRGRLRRGIRPTGSDHRRHPDDAVHHRGHHPRRSAATVTRNLPPGEAWCVTPTSAGSSARANDGTTTTSPPLVEPTGGSSTSRGCTVDALPATPASVQWRKGATGRSTDRSTTRRVAVA